MTSNAANSSPSRPAPGHGRRVWPWIVGILAVPLVAVGFAAYGVVHLDRSASALRSELIAATGGNWQSRVQLTVGPGLVSTVRAGLALAHDVPAEAREALGALHSASVGVYLRKAREGGLHLPAKFWSATDRIMARRGWTRVVRVVDRDSLVLVYVPAGRAGRQPSRACVAVCNGQDLVVVTARFSPDRLGRFLAREIGDRVNLGHGWHRKG